MDLRYLRYFVTIAEERSFTRAAERLHTVQPSLSSQMKRLEEIVGTPLFDRSKHHLELTEAGRSFLNDARYILEYADQSMERARRAARAEAGCLTIGLLPNLQNSPAGRLIHYFLERRAGFEVRLRSMSSPEQMSALREQTIDVGFVAGEFEEPDIAQELFLAQAIVVALPPGHRLAQSERVGVADLADTAMVAFSPAKLPGPFKIARKLAADAGVRFRSTVEVDALAEALKAVEQGYGFAFLPQNFEPRPASVTVVALALEPTPTMDLHLAYRRDNRMPALEFFLTLARELGQGAGKSPEADSSLRSE